MNKKLYIKNFNSIFMILISLCTVASVIFMATVAYFFDGDWASNNIQTAGRVEVSCVGASATDYIDISGSGKLEIGIPDITNTSILIPNMPVGLRANAKVHASDSIAMLRAKVEVSFNNKDAFTSKTDDDFADLNDLFISAIESADTVSENWYKHDGFWYYVGANDRNGADTRLVVINHNLTNNTSCDYVDSDGNSYVDFIDKDFRIPKSIDQTWTDLEVIIKITFFVVQGFLPDKTGIDIGDENKTITRALPLFNNEEITI